MFAKCPVAHSEISVNFRWPQTSTGEEKGTFKLRLNRIRQRKDRQIFENLKSKTLPIGRVMALESKYNSPQEFYVRVLSCGAGRSELLGGCLIWLPGILPLSHAARSADHTSRRVTPFDLCHSYLQNHHPPNH